MISASSRLLRALSVLFSVCFLSVFCLHVCGLWTAATENHVLPGGLAKILKGLETARNGEKWRETARNGGSWVWDFVAFSG